jgi:4a-hydroxytetrahydrobiopterin dehydratase
MSDSPSREKMSPGAAREALRGLEGWEYDEEKVRIKKSFKTRGFSEAMALAVRVGVIAASWNHHPDFIEIRYDKVKLSYSTHDAGGVTGYDITCARAIEGLDDPV